MTHGRADGNEGICLYQDKQKLYAFRTDVTGKGLILIPDLTKDPIDEDKTGDLLFYSHANQPGIGGDIRNVVPTLETDILDGTNLPRTKAI